jgi:deazaflavin-dependent oxidoreductase (nitroreductase family)
MLNRQAVAKTYAPTRTTKAFNAFAKTLVQLGIPTGSIAVLTVSGRRTGQPRSTPVNLHVENGRRYLVSPYGHVGWVQNVRKAGGRAHLKARGRNEDVRLQELPLAQSAPFLKYYAEHFKVTAPFFDAKPGDPVERFAAEADKHPVFEILPG